jgi:hypothetical protein
MYLSRLLAQPSLQAYEKKLGYPPIKSFRYLLQDSPKGFFLTDKFIDGLDFLGKKGFAFDLTLDVTHKETGGPLILDDAVEAISRVRELQKEKGYETKFILGEFGILSIRLFRSDNLTLMSLCAARPFRQTRFDCRRYCPTFSFPNRLYFFAVRTRAPSERLSQAIGAPRFRRHSCCSVGIQGFRRRKVKQRETKGNELRNVGRKDPKLSRTRDRSFRGIENPGWIR